MCVCVWGGQPKHPRHDAWDRAMDERDARLKEEYAKSQVSDQLRLRSFGRARILLLLSWTLGFVHSVA